MKGQAHAAAVGHGRCHEVMPLQLRLQLHEERQQERRNSHTSTVRSADSFCSVMQEQATRMEHCAGLHGGW